jgi:hypothetical protein
MLKRLLLTTALVVAVTPVLASNIALIMWTDGADAVTQTGTGSVDLGPQNLDGVTITLTTGNRVINPNGLNEANINIDNTTSSVQTLNVILGANGYLGTNDEFRVSGTIIADSGKSDLAGSYFVDSANTLNGQSASVTGTDIRNFDSGLLTGPLSFSFNGTGADLVTGPFGMAERLTLTLNPGASVGVQGVAMVAVPEPRTWVMMVAGFGLMALGVGRNGLMAMLGLKRRKQARVAFEG